MIIYGQRGFTRDLVIHVNICIWILLLCAHPHEQICPQAHMFRRPLAYMPILFTRPCLHSLPLPHHLPPSCFPCQYPPHPEALVRATHRA